MTLMGPFGSPNTSPMIPRGSRVTDKSSSREVGDVISGVFGRREKLQRFYGETSASRCHGGPIEALLQYPRTSQHSMMPRDSREKINSNNCNSPTINLNYIFFQSNKIFFVALKEKFLFGNDLFKPVIGASVNWHIFFIFKRNKSTRILQYPRQNTIQKVPVHGYINGKFQQIVVYLLRNFSRLYCV